MDATNQVPNKVSTQKIVFVVVLLILLQLFTYSCDENSYKDGFDFDYEIHDDTRLPFILKVYKDIHIIGGYTNEKWSMVLRNRDDGSACYIRPIVSAEGIRKLFYMSHDTVRYVIDDNMRIPMGVSNGSVYNHSNNFSSSVKNDGIDVRILIRQYHEDDDGGIVETTIPDMNDSSSWRRTPIRSSERRAIYDSDLQDYLYIIAIDEKKDWIWIYDSNDSIVYRSPSLNKFHKEEPYLAKRYEQKVL